MTDWNRGIIEEFRANKGRVKAFAHQPLLLLHHRGAKSGTERVNPLAYQELENGWAVFASKGGAPTNPDWYHNLVANPRARVEVGNETVDVVARVAKGEEHERIWEEQKRRNPGFADYEVKTSRQIPVIVLERVPFGDAGSGDRESSRG
ncbi:MAG: nitroreductase family deazaflavin-dependent oxidoreductase [Actinomycetota bacterium]|nr:nitroreductase family deazaflavin-dependent oxidoreductase [Actinomycetota bacterium]